jgi:hypothetical protein
MSLPEGHYFWPPLSVIQEYQEQLKAEALLDEAKRHVMAAQIYLEAVHLYEEEGEVLRAATLLRRYAQHCKRCGYRFSEAEDGRNVNREICDETVGDSLCWKEQEQERNRERRQAKTADTPATTDDRLALPQAPKARKASLYKKLQRKRKG